MRRDNLVCPNEHVILGAVVKTEDHIVYLTNLEGVVNVVYSALLVVAGDVSSVSLVICEILIEHLDAVVSVTADKRVRKLAVHQSDSFLCICPLLI